MDPFTWASALGLLKGIGGFLLKHWTWFAVAGLALALWAANGALKHTRAELTAARAEIVTLNATVAGLRTSLAASEKNRAAEFAGAKAAVSEAALACDARVAEARRSQRVIRSIVEKPVPSDPGTHCPVPDRVSADELRNALQPAR